MNRSGSHTVRTQTMKIIYLLWTPASGPLRGTAGQGNFFIFLSLIRRGGVPSGGSSNHKQEESGDNLRIMAE